MAVETFKTAFKALKASVMAKGHIEAHVSHFTNAVWNHLEAYRMYEKEIQKQKSTVQSNEIKTGYTQRVR